MLLDTKQSEAALITDSSPARTKAQKRYLDAWSCCAEFAQPCPVLSPADTQATCCGGGSPYGICMLVQIQHAIQYNIPAITQRNLSIQYFIVVITCLQFGDGVEMCYTCLVSNGYWLVACWAFLSHQRQDIQYVGSNRNRKSLCPQACLEARIDRRQRTIASGLSMWVLNGCMQLPGHMLLVAFGASCFQFLLSLFTMWHVSACECMSQSSLLACAFSMPSLTQSFDILLH